MMLSNKHHREHRSTFQTSLKKPTMPKQLNSGTLSPETSTTTSSGYSTGGSSLSTIIKSSLQKSSSSSTASKRQQQQQQHYQEQKTKPKGFQNLLTKLKNLLIPPKPKPIHTKPMRSTTSRQISSTNVIRQYRQQSPLYDGFPSSSSTAINNPVSLPFTYYYYSPIRQSRSNFEKISAWLNQTEKMRKSIADNNDISFIDASQQQSISSSSTDINNLGITVVRKRNSMNIKPPKRSSSLVTRITRPIIEQQLQRTISPSSSFSSAILTKGMSERMTPPPPPLPEKSKTNRRRAIDFSRRRTVAGINEQKFDKENIYQFPSSSTSTNKPDVQYPSSSSKTSVGKKYYFHPNLGKTNEDLLNNSYGLTLLNQQQSQPSQQQRHSTATVLMISQVPNQHFSEKQINRRTSSTQQHTLDSLEDLLCDKEVESYFYPKSTPSDHIYMNLDNPLPLSYIHGTLC